ncbi:MAG: hypothetical protein ACM3VS_01875 [Candidatus Dadabacteria bacterium]
MLNQERSFSGSFNLFEVLRYLFDFFVFTSLFITVCALLMTYQTALLFNVPVSFNLMGFIASGTICSYNFHWYLTPPDIPHPSVKLKWNIANRPIHLLLFIIGLIAAVYFTFMLRNHWFWLCVTAFLTFMYSAPKMSFPFFVKLRKVAIAKTIFLAFAWAHVTSLLPVVTMVKEVGAQHIWFLVNRFFYIYAICIIFDFRDVEKDREAGIKSLITFLNEKGIDRLFWFSLAVFTITLVILLQWITPAEAFVLFFPGIIVALLYYPSKTNYSDYLYYFILDGLMMLSAPFLILIKFAR